MNQKKERSLIKKLFITLLPLQAVAIGLPAVNDLINSLIIGSVMGPAATAAIGFAGPFTLFISAISSMISGGSQLVCGRSLGSGNKKVIRTVYATTILVSMACGLILILLTQICPDFIVKILGVSSESAAMTASYIRGIGLGAMFSILIACLIPFLQIDHAGTICTIVVIVQLVFNIGGTLLNVLVIKGGLMGVGTATSIANFAATLIAFIYLQIKSELFKFEFKSFDIRTIKPVIYSGSPNAINPICSMISDILINNMVYAIGGTAAVAAKAVAVSLSTSLGSFIDGGYMGAARIIGSVLVGEKDSSSLRDLSKIMVETAWYLYIGAFVIILIFARPIASLYVSDPEEIALYAGVIIVYNLWFPISFFKDPAIAIYQAMDRMKEVALLTVLNKLIFPVLLAWGIGAWLGLPWLMSYTFFSVILMVIVMVVMFAARAHRLPRSIFELCYIPSTISAPREDRFKAVVNTAAEACRASEGIIQFCKDKGMDARKAYFAGLAIEEILVFTIRNRFKNGDETIDARVIYSEGGISILIRDACTEFDIIKWLDLCNPEDGEKSIGIRMVKAFSKDMNYMSTLGLNVLNIKL